MQIKEYEAFTLKECLQQVRNDLGPDAVILETRKFRKGGLLGWGSREAICIVAATGITVQQDLEETRSGSSARSEKAAAPISAKNGARAVTAAPASSASSGHTSRATSTAKTADSPPAAPSQKAAAAAARAAFARSASPPASTTAPTRPAATTPRPERAPSPTLPTVAPEYDENLVSTNGKRTPTAKSGASEDGGAYLAQLEQTMREIKESLTTLQQEQREAQERTVTAVVSAVAPTVTANRPALIEEEPEVAPVRFPELHERLIASGVSEALATDLLESLPDFDAWSPEAQTPLAEAALRDLVAHRVASAGPIVLTPGRLKAVALIGPTGVGKTTTIAKLAAHFSLVERKRVALLTVDTYRIAAVEQLKTYSQIIDIPIGVAYSQAEVLPAVEQFADYDLLLIDTAGRSQKNVMQVGELKTLLEAVHCETHLVLSACIKEQDMLDAAQRFSAARVDRILFSKLDETSTYGSLLNVAERTGIPLSYLTTGQKVPEDIEVAEGSKLADLILSDTLRA